MAPCYTEPMREIKPTTIRLTEEDKRLINEIKRRYGLESVAQAIRLALRMLVERKDGEG